MTEQTHGESASSSRKLKINPKIAGTILVLIVLGVLAYQYKHFFVAATVDGKVINRFKVIQRLENQNGQEALNALIENQLINNAASKNNITVSEADINKKLDGIRSQVEASGATLDTALSAAGMTLDELKNQITLQLKLEKLMGDKLNVTDEEVNKYITDNQITVATDKEVETKNQVREQIRSQKFSNLATSFVADLRTSAKVKTYVEY